MRAENDGLTIWYGGPDTPCPDEDGAPRTGQSVIAAVKPGSVGNVVNVRYRVGTGPERVTAAYEIGRNYSLDVQYFRAALPPLLEGDLVEYVPVVTCSGRQAPAPNKTEAFSSRFRLADPAPAVPEPGSPPRNSDVGPKFTPEFKFVASVKVFVSKTPEVIGDTPDGLRINYFLDGGGVTGPDLQAHFLPRGTDYLTIRRDGVAILQVRATMKTNDGALITEENTGFLDMGQGGYERALRGEFPDYAALQVAPKFMTAHANYLWMNRHEFIGVGRVSTVDDLVEYDLYVVNNEIPKS